MSCVDTKGSAAVSEERPQRVKICGLMRLADAHTAAHAGADFLGTILSDGYGRSVQASFARQISEEIGLPVVGVTVDEPLERIVDLAEEAGVAVLQLHGAETPELIERLRDRGDWTIWKALRARTTDEVEAAMAEFGPVADGLLLDGWHPEHRGGSGVRFPWDLVEPIRDRFPADLTFVAAGGLRPSNVAEAVRRLSPDIVDVSSGVEITRGVKDAGRINAFIRNARASRAKD